MINKCENKRNVLVKDTYQKDPRTLQSFPIWLPSELSLYNLCDFSTTKQESPDIINMPFIHCKR